MDRVLRHVEVQVELLWMPNNFEILCSHLPANMQLKPTLKKAAKNSFPVPYFPIYICQCLNFGSAIFTAYLNC